MKTTTKLLMLSGLLLFSSLSIAQEEEKDSLVKVSPMTKQEKQQKVGNIYLEEQIEILLNQKEKVEKQEREYLKLDIGNINDRLDRGVITAAEAEKLKKEAAEKRAANIQDKQEIIDKKIALLKRADLPYQAELPDHDGDNVVIRIGGNKETDNGFIYIGDKSGDKPRRYDLRTREDVVFAIGFNNAIIDGQSLNDSPYRIGGSGFMELGYAWTTRVFNNSNFLRVKYGFSFQWNKLNIKDNNFLVNNNDNIELQQFPVEVNKVKFRSTNLVIPVHFEFGPSKKIERDSYFRYTTYNQLKVGIGGYAGLNIGSMQKIKYKEDGNRIKNKQRGGFEVSEFVYGLSAYVAWGGIGIYAKYDLNPIFKNQTIDQNNISLGVRFDMD